MICGSKSNEENISNRPTTDGQMVIGLKEDKIATKKRKKIDNQNKTVKKKKKLQKSREERVMNIG